MSKNLIFPLSLSAILSLELGLSKGLIKLNEGKVRQNLGNIERDTARVNQ